MLPVAPELVMPTVLAVWRFAPEARVNVPAPEMIFVPQMSLPLAVSVPTAIVKLSAKVTVFPKAMFTLWSCPVLVPHVTVCKPKPTKLIVEVPLAVGADIVPLLVIAPPILYVGAPVPLLTVHVPPNSIIILPFIVWVGVPVFVPRNSAPFLIVKFPFMVIEVFAAF